MKLLTENAGWYETWTYKSEKIGTIIILNNKYKDVWPNRFTSKLLLSETGLVIPKLQIF